MTTIYSEVVNGTHTATSYTGAGTGLTNIPRTGISTGTANQVVINNATGILSAESQLSPLRGGLGFDVSQVSGPSVLTVASGVPSSVAYTTAATASTIVARDATGFISAAGINAPNFAQTAATVTGGIGRLITSNVQTTNATATTLLSFPTTSNGVHGTSYTFATIIDYADATGGVNTGAYQAIYKVKNIGGTLTVSLPAAILSIVDGALSAVVVSMTNSGANALLQVAGIASTNVNWCAMTHVVSQDF